MTTFNIRVAMRQIKRNYTSRGHIRMDNLWQYAVLLESRGPLWQYEVLLESSGPPQAVRLALFDQYCDRTSPARDLESVQAEVETYAARVAAVLDVEVLYFHAEEREVTRMELFNEQVESILP